MKRLKEDVRTDRVPSIIRAQSGCVVSVVLGSGVLGAGDSNADHGKMQFCGAARLDKKSMFRDGDAGY